MEQITGCSIQPGTTDVDLDGRDAVLVRYNVFLPPGTRVFAGDRLFIGGQPYRVFGEPDRWETGINDHVRVDVEEWSG